ncbi:endoribonuclease L-PSP [Kribbella orskensis]|uniref:Endoribonuclease L-PSP n=1 Tax=Kribbella orskensis TaxID=2512216 RepID=A0ABY2BRN1_9ACTN|nr:MULTISPECIES: Rid family hydrolase [Kribbella]TCN29311.1 endoribonuclease L-PSP [Kribbella sp. VKM Ac-2500]TCO28001.1 endoribonuclease L-PSP [Kribbella orskensis]
MNALAIQPLNPPILPAATGNYTHGVQVNGAGRLVFVSGQVPWADGQGQIPAAFEDQCRMVWRNVLAVAAG